MYNVILDKPAYQSGREFVRTAVTSQTSGTPFPAGTENVLAFFVAQAEETLDEYLKYREQNYGQRIIFSLLLRTATSLTLAAELATELHYVMRLSYNPLPNETPSNQQRMFANEADKLIRLMRRFANNLKQVKGGDDTAGSSELELQENLRIRIAYAMHIADLAVKLTQPANYAFHHPEAKTCLALRAAVRRSAAASFIALAKLDESAAKAL